MPTLQLPVDDAGREAARREELSDYEVRAAAAQPVLEDLTNLAANLCGTPLVLIDLPGERRLWYRSATGLDADAVRRIFAQCHEDADSAGRCGLHVARRESRRSERKRVTGLRPVRFYAAVTLHMPGGELLGALAVIDHRSRAMSCAQREGLCALGRQVVAHYELQRTAAELARAVEARAVAEGARREAEERFHEFMNNSPALAYIKDDAGRFVYVNERTAQRFERPAAEWIGKSDAEIIGAADVSAVVEHDLSVLNEEKSLVIEEVATTPDGSVRCWLSHKFLLHDGERKQVGGLSFDITARKQAEQERERLVNELRDALADVKTLAGFLPICASCKNIRTDQGYWQQIETYLAEHSELEFTHGICPACLEKMYPEFAAYQRLQSSPPPPDAS